MKQPPPVGAKRVLDARCVELLNGNVRHARGVVVNVQERMHRMLVTELVCTIGIPQQSGTLLPVLAIVLFIFFAEVIRGAAFFIIFDRQIHISVCPTLCLLSWLRRIRLALDKLLPHTHPKPSF